MKVERIQRGGSHENGIFERKTALDVAKEHYPEIISTIKTNLETLITTPFFYYII